MPVLIDTQAFLWFVFGQQELSQRGREALNDRSVERYISIASLWEIAIKHKLGKLHLNPPLDRFLTEQLAATGVTILSIQPSHVFELDRLTLVHKDPFDRMLAAQARVERCPIVSVDRIFDEYGLDRIW